MKNGDFYLLRNKETGLWVKDNDKSEETIVANYTEKREQAKKYATLNDAKTDKHHGEEIVEVKEN